MSTGLILISVFGLPDLFPLLAQMRSDESAEMLLDIASSEQLYNSIKQTRLEVAKNYHNKIGPSLLPRLLPKGPFQPSNLGLLFSFKTRAGKSCFYYFLGFSCGGAQEKTLKTPQVQNVQRFAGKMKRNIS
jgi:hypothetical protein